MPGTLKREGGWLRQLVLWPLALIGAVALGLVAVGMMTFEGRHPAGSAPAAGITPSPLVAGSTKRTLTDAEQATFERSCKICHESSGTGAPRTGDTEAWQPVLDQGMPALLEHTISGHKGMPPMGMCMDCGEAEFIAFIEYMGQFESGVECDS